MCRGTNHAGSSNSIARIKKLVRNTIVVIEYGCPMFLRCKVALFQSHWYGDARDGATLARTKSSEVERSEVIVYDTLEWLARLVTS